MAKDNLKSLLKCITREHVYIQPHNFPDPDALASARGLQVLLSCCNISSTICYAGRIDKNNTLKMIELLHIDVCPVDTIQLQAEDEIILVDCQKGNNNVMDFTGNEIACIDHHKLQDTDCYRFFDIRSNVGSCSTIITSYFMEHNIPIDRELATILFYGLKMDTSNLTRGVSELDVAVFSYLHEQVDHSVIFQLDSNSLTIQDLDAYVHAIDNLWVEQRIGFTNLGYNFSDAILATLADFLLTLKEIDFIITFSLRDDGIKLSVRSALEHYNCALIIKNALKDYGGDGGGHSHMAAGFVPIDPRDAMSVASKLQVRFVEEISKSRK